MITYELHKLYLMRGTLLGALSFFSLALFLSVPCLGDRADSAQSLCPSFCMDYRDFDLSVFDPSALEDRASGREA